MKKTYLQEGQLQSHAEIANCPLQKHLLPPYTVLFVSVIYQLHPETVRYYRSRANHL